MKRKLMSAIQDIRKKQTEADREETETEREREREREYDMVDRRK